MALKLPLTASEISQRCGATLIGNPDILVEAVAPISDIRPHTLTFLSDRRFLPKAEAMTEAVVLTRPELADSGVNATFLTVIEPRTAFFKLLRELDIKQRGTGQVHPTAFVDASCVVHSTAVIGAGVQVGPRTRIGAGTILRAGVFVGSDVVIGEDCEIHPKVTVLNRVAIGDRVTIFSGTVIGGDGFGYLTDGGEHIEIPQLGIVTIEDNVRIGANCTIDRATLGSTRIGRGTKIDNLVHIAHNCNVGMNCLICAQVGLGGSTTLEDNVILGGQVGLGDHVVVGKGAKMGGQSGSSTNVRGNETYFLTPALPIKEVYRVVKSLRRLPALFDRVRTLETLREKRE